MTTLYVRVTGWLRAAWQRVEGPWASDGRLGFRLILISCITTIVVGGLGSSSVTLNVGEANGSWLPPYFIGEATRERLRLPLSEWIVVPALWISITLGAVGLWIACRAVGAGWRPRVRLMFGLGVGLNLSTILVPPLTSADILMYAAYGRLQRQGFDPYSITPAEVFRQAFDPVLVLTERPWQDTPSVYGPMASASQWIANWLGGESMHDIVFWLQVIAVVPFIIICAIMIKLAHGDAAMQTRSVLYTICNPLLIWAVVAGAHNEALTLVFAIIALWFVRRSAFWTGIFIGLAGSVKVSLVFYGLAMMWGYRREPRKLVALCVGAVIPLAIGYGLIAPAALFAAGRNTGYVSGGSWALPVLYGIGMILPWELAKSVIGISGWVGTITFAWMLSRVVPWQAVPGASVAAERDPLTITVRTALVLCTAWIITSPYTLPWYDLIAWAPLALMATNRLFGVLTVRGAALSVAYVTGRAVEFSEAMQGVSFVVRDVLCSAIQIGVLVAVVLWWKQEGAEIPRWMQRRKAAIETG